MEFRVLGPLTVWRNGQEVPIGAAKLRALLTLLLLRQGGLVPTETLVDELWGERPPATAVKLVQVYVSQLRKVLGEGVLETRPAGYLLRIDPDDLDSSRFAGLVERGQRMLAEGEAAEAGEILRQALRLWRGAPLSEFRHEDFARHEIVRLEELRLVALENRLRADLALGRHGAVVPELRALVREHPLRERFRELLMLALYRAGQQAEALAVYQDGRTALVEELGIEPSESLRHLEIEILRHNPKLDVPEAGESMPSGTQLSPTMVPQLAERAGGETGGRVRAVYSAQSTGEALGTFLPPHAAGPNRDGRRRTAGVVAAAVVAITAAVILATTIGLGTPSKKASPVSANGIGIFDANTGTLSGQVPLGASPSAVTACDGSIWTADVDAHTVSRIDPVKQVVIQTIQVGSGPDAITCGGGFVWAANGLSGTVAQIDPQTDTAVNTIPVGSDPVGIIAGGRYVWVADSSDGSVTRIDMRTDRPLQPIPVGQSADGIAVGFGSVWVTSEASGTVTRIEPNSGNVIEPIQTGSSADAVTTGDGGVWVANDLDGTVTRIDPTTNTIGATIPVGDGPDGIAVAARSIWVSDEVAGTLAKIDPGKNTVVRTVTTDNRPEGVVLSSGSLFVPVRASGTGHRGGTLTVLDSGGGSDLDVVDPALVYTPGEDQIVDMTNDGLTGFRRVGGASGTYVVPDLASSLPVPTDGGLTYTFELRPNIHYSTGDLVKPEDFRWAIERAIELNGDSGYAQYYTLIVGAQRCLAEPTRACDLSRGIVTDDGLNLVAFHLTKPDPDFLDQLALPAAEAVPVGTPLHPRGFVAATGPYQVASFDPAHSIRLVRNSRFRLWSQAAQPAGFPDVIVEKVQGGPDAHVSAAVRGSADLASQLNIDPPALSVMDLLQTQHASLLEVNPARNTYFLALNTRAAPFDDVRARQALNFALDRQRLLDLTLGQGFGEVTCQVLPPDFNGYEPYCPYTVGPSTTGTWAAPDLERARQLVRSSATAGQTVNVWIPTWLLINAAAGRYVLSVLDSLGYVAHLRFAADPWAGSAKHAPQISFYAWLSDYPTPGGFITPTLSCGVSPENGNPSEFCDPAIDRQVQSAESLQASNPEAATQLWAEVEHEITDKAPWAPFANGDVFEVKAARVDNYQFNPQWSTLLDQLWVR